MPPRIPNLTCLRASASATPSSTITLPFRPFSSNAVLQAKISEKERAKERAKHDPYLVAQRNRKKAANLTRRSELEAARVASLGDPVRGVSTSFVESFDTGKPITYEKGKKIPEDKEHLNYAFEPDLVKRQLQASRHLAVPLSERETQTSGSSAYSWGSAASARGKTEEIKKSSEEIREQTDKEHARAAEAIARITALANGSSKDRMRVNINRCVQTFGRHNTDKIFPPRAPALANLRQEKHRKQPPTNVKAAAKRVGPDTGSSEVQIAILTAKIKTMADFLATRGKNDKHNKRNLRLLVHKRQKLLQYLQRKERGGPRWQHCIETLGLTEGTWKGEISL